MSQTRGSHSSLRQSHLKSETGQRREKISKLDLDFILNFFFSCLKRRQVKMLGQILFKLSCGFVFVLFFLDFSAPVTLR